jgi:hypothetical protein
MNTCSDQSQYIEIANLIANVLREDVIKPFEDRIDRLDNKLERIENNIDEIESRIQRLEAAFEEKNQWRLNEKMVVRQMSEKTVLGGNKEVFFRNISSPLPIFLSCFRIPI